MVTGCKLKRKYIITPNPLWKHRFGKGPKIKQTIEHGCMHGKVDKLLILHKFK